MRWRESACSKLSEIYCQTLSYLCLGPLNPLSQISLFDSFSIVSFYSLATFCKLSNWYVNLSNIIFFSFTRVLSSCSLFLLLSSSPSILLREPTALSFASSIFCAYESSTSIRVLTMSLKFMIFLRKSMHSPLRFSVSRYLSAASTRIWLFSSNVMFTSILPSIYLSINLYKFHFG